MKLPLPIGSYAHYSLPASARRLVNCYAEAAPQDAKAPVILTRSPGIKAFATPGSGPIRGLARFNGLLHAVSGTGLYRVAQDGSATLLGTIPGAGRVDLAVSTQSLAICTAPATYLWNGTTLARITDPDYTSRGAAQVEFLDNYLLFIEPNSGRFFCADLADDDSFDALNFATAEAAPDHLVGFVVDHREIILGGEKSIELWYNGGGSGFPFVRSSNGYVEQGVAAGASMAKADHAVFWLADDFTVRRLAGTTAVRVSNHGIENVIRAMSRKDDAFADTYTQGGHVFYVLTFPTDGRTLVLDITTGEWHERQSYGIDRWRVNAIVPCYERIFVGDYATNKIGYLDPDTFDEWGDVQRMVWTYQPVAGEGLRGFHSELEVLMETGVGLVTGQGSNPLATLNVSDDGGQSFRAMPTKSIGRQGERRSRVRWNRLGSSRDRVYQVEVSDPVKVVVHDTRLSVKGGRL